MLWDRTCCGTEQHVVGQSMLWGRACCGTEPVVGQSVLWDRAYCGPAEDKRSVAEFGLWRVNNPRPAEQLSTVDRCRGKL